MEMTRTAYYRCVVKCGSPVSGFYRFENVFQILPIKDIGDATERNTNYIALEFSHQTPINNSESENDDFIHIDRTHLDSAQELIALVYITTNSYLRLHYDRRVNILPPPQEEISGFSETQNLHNLRKTPGRVSALQNFTNAFLAVDSDIDLYLTNYFNLDDKARNRYRTSLILLQSVRNVMRESTSLAIVGLVSSIENLMDWEAKRSKTIFEKCEACKQKKYTLGSRFTDFILTYADHPEMATEPEIKKFYGLRSKITHAGGLVDMDAVLSRFSYREHINLYVQLERMVRMAIYNYLLRYNVRE